MKIGIFVHSQSGHTSALGLAIADNLRAKGHEVDIELLRSVKRARPRMKHVELRNAPEIDSFDVVVFGGPIWGFAPSPLIVSYIGEITHLKNKKALCFATSGFPGALSNGKNALRKINAKLDALGAQILEGESFFWGFWRKNRMRAAVERICATIVA
jgi:flavodoxin